MHAEAKFDFASTPGKLPKDVRPTEYSIRIAPDLQKLTFTGSETVRLHAKKPVTKLVLNALEMEIASASLDGRPLPEKAIVLDEAEQTLTLNLPNELSAGDHNWRSRSAEKLTPRDRDCSTRAIRSRERTKRRSCSGRNLRRPMRAGCFPAGMSRVSARVSSSRWSSRKTSPPFPTCRWKARKRSPAARKCAFPLRPPCRVTSWCS